MLVNIPYMDPMGIDTKRYNALVKGKIYRKTRFPEN
jgi:hypothetical protein